MTKQSNDSTITLEPSWKNHFIGYLISALLVPLFGIGLIGLYLVYKRQHSHSYTFSNKQLTSKGQKYERHIDLISISDVQVKQTYLQKKMGVGDIILQTSASSATLRGLDDPRQLKELFEKAIETEQQRHEEKKETEPREPEYDPGTRDRMNYLTGLWQQGLVSEEDYEEEREHFE